MIPAALFLALLLTLGYLWHRDHLRAEARTADLQATIDDQADTAALHVEIIAANEGTIGHQERVINALSDTAALYLQDRDWERMLRTIAEAEADRNATALRGLLEHQAHAELKDPRAPIGDRAGVVVEVQLIDGRLRLPEREADVVPLRGKGRRA